MGWVHLLILAERCWGGLWDIWEMNHPQAELEQLATFRPAKGLERCLIEWLATAPGNNVDWTRIPQLISVLP